MSDLHRIQNQLLQKKVLPRRINKLHYTMFGPQFLLLNIKLKTKSCILPVTNCSATIYKITQFLLQASYNAYQSWLKANPKKEQELLPGLNLTHNQLFFLSFSQVQPAPLPLLLPGTTSSSSSPSPRYNQLY